MERLLDPRAAGAAVIGVLFLAMAGWTPALTLEGTSDSIAATATLPFPPAAGAPGADAVGKISTELRALLAAPDLPVPVIVQTVRPRVAPSPLAMRAADGMVYIQDTALLWDATWTQGAIWGGGTGSASGVSLTPVPLAITTADGGIWGGERFALKSTSGTVTNDGAVWGEGRVRQVSPLLAFVRAPFDPEFLLLVACACLAAPHTLNLGHNARISTLQPFMLAGIALFGAGHAVVLAGVSMIFFWAVGRPRLPFYKGLFNFVNFALSAFAGGQAYYVAGGWGTSPPRSPSSPF